MKGVRLDRNSIDSRKKVSCGTIDGLTDDGRSLLRDIESDDVWKICLDTLEGADVDLSYPLLKDVCETIVKRYVESFIPNKIGR